MVQIFETQGQPGLGALLGGGIGQGIQQGLQQMIQGKALSQILGLDPKSAGQLGSLPKEMQTAVLTSFMKSKAEGVAQQRKIELEEMKQAGREKLALEREKTKSEYESPEIKKYRESLGLREETATQIMPALENARSYKNDPARYIPGTAAHKSLGDLATRAFAFYKPLFGGRLTQREFVNSISNLASDKTFPGGFDQALNIIESMTKQATMEADLFSNYLESGMSPMKARKNALKDMREKSNEIVDILKSGSKFQTFNIKGTNYTIPSNKVEEFKKEAGIE